MPQVIEGDVLEETLNLQVVRRPAGLKPRLVVIHLQTGHVLPLIDLLTSERYFEQLVIGGEDLAALQGCKKRCANALKKREDKKVERSRKLGELVSNAERIRRQSSYAINEPINSTTISVDDIF